MSAMSINFNHPNVKQLQELINRDDSSGKIGVFVGSGMSKPADFPTWSECLEEMNKYANENLRISTGTSEEYLKLSDKSKNTYTAYFLRQQLGEDKYWEILKKLFDPPVFKIPRGIEILKLLCERKKSFPY
ncbi:MAG: hypothetical protein AB1546_08760 [bacterium]